MELKRGIARVIDANISPAALHSLRLKEAWENVAPQSVLDHTDNIGSSKKGRNSLVVYVDTPHCAANLTMRKEYFRQMMEHELGGTVENIFFVVSKSTGIRKKFAKREAEQPWYVDEAEPAPLTEGELAYARFSVDEIEDAQLKETLLKAFISDLEWKKGIKLSKTPQTEN